MTAILETALSKTIDVGEGRQSARKRVLAELMAEFVTTGRATMPDGRILDAAPKDWIETVKWVYAHIDGPPKQELELSGSLGFVVDIDADDPPAS